MEPEKSTPSEMDLHFDVLLEDCELPYKKRSKLYLRILNFGKRTTRKELMLRQRLIKHFYLQNMTPKEISEKTGFASAYVKHIIKSNTRKSMTSQDVAKVQVEVEAIERDFTAEGVGGVLAKMDKLATLTYRELVTRLLQEPENFENRDLAYLLNGILNQFNQLVDRIRTADPSSTAKFLTTSDALDVVEENRDLLDKVEVPEDREEFKIVGQDP